MSITTENRNKNWEDVKLKLNAQYSTILSIFIKNKGKIFNRWDISELSGLPITTISGRLTEMSNYMFILEPSEIINNRVSYKLLDYDVSIERASKIFSYLMDKESELIASLHKLEDEDISAKSLIFKELKKIKSKLNKISTILDHRNI